MNESLTVLMEQVQCYSTACVFAVHLPAESLMLDVDRDTDITIAPQATETLTSTLWITSTILFLHQPSDVSQNHPSLSQSPGISASSSRPTQSSRNLLPLNQDKSFISQSARQSLQLGSHYVHSWSQYSAQYTTTHESPGSASLFRPMTTPITPPNRSSMQITLVSSSRQDLDKTEHFESKSQSLGRSTETIEDDNSEPRSTGVRVSRGNDSTAGHTYTGVKFSGNATKKSPGIFFQFWYYFVVLFGLA